MAILKSPTPGPAFMNESMPCTSARLRKILNCSNSGAESLYWKTAATPGASHRSANGGSPTCAQAGNHCRNPVHDLTAIEHSHFGIGDRRRVRFRPAEWVWTGIRMCLALMLGEQRPSLRKGVRTTEQGSGSHEKSERDSHRCIHLVDQAAGQPPGCCCH